jgi:acetolactate synthase-like protein
MLEDDVGTVLNYSNYQRVVEGFGAAGFQVKDPELIPETLQQAIAAASDGRPVLVNAILVKTDFRKGSISM